jgi:ribose transport system ATP-binding protein
MGADEGDTERLLIDGLTLARDVPPIHDIVRAGEIVGLAGLEGHGQEPFLETLCGLRSPLSGRLMVEAHGRWVAIASFRRAVRCGVAYLARDRRANGIFPSLSILDNFALVSMDRDRSFGLIDRRKQRARYETYQRRLSIVAPSPDRAWLALEPRVLLLNDPTRGVDQRTRETLYQVFRDLARNEGMALVLLSTEIEELLRLCERVLVFREQHVTARLAGAHISHDQVIGAMFGRVE